MEKELKVQREYIERLLAINDAIYQEAYNTEENETFSQDYPTLFAKIVHLNGYIDALKIVLKKDKESDEK